jgi:hypothetical protein
MYRTRLVDVYFLLLCFWESNPACAQGPTWRTTARQLRRRTQCACAWWRSTRPGTVCVSALPSGRRDYRPHSSRFVHRENITHRKQSKICGSSKLTANGICGIVQLLRSLPGKCCGSGCGIRWFFEPPRSGIRDWKKAGSGNWDEHSRSFFW